MTEDMEAIVTIRCLQGACVNECRICALSIEAARKDACQRGWSVSEDGWDLCPMHSQTAAATIIHCECEDCGNVWTDESDPEEAMVNARKKGWTGTSTQAYCHWCSATHHKEPAPLTKADVKEIAIVMLEQLCDAILADPWFKEGHLRRSTVLYAKESLRASK